MVVDLTIRWSTPFSVFVGTFATDDPDKYLDEKLGIYGSSRISYGVLSRGCYKAYLFTLTNIYALSFVFLVNTGPQLSS